MERRIFQVIVVLATVVPIAAGAAGLLEGPLILHGVSVASADLQSHFRYLSGLLLGIGVAFLVCARDPERHAGLYRALSLIVIVGGLGRVFGAIECGSPTGANRLAFVMELVVVPMLLLWLGRIERRASRQKLQNRGSKRIEATGGC